MNTRAPASRTGGHRLLRWGSPAALLALTLAHAPYRADPAAQLERIGTSSHWILVHVGLLVGFAAFDVALLTWPSSHRLGSRLRWLGVLVHLVAYSAFVAVDGVAGGLLAQAGVVAPSGLRPGLAAGLSVLFTAGPVVALALTAGLGWLLAVGTIVAELSATPRCLPAAGLLLSAVVVMTYRHSAPVGPIGAALALMAAAALELGEHRPATDTHA